MNVHFKALTHYLHNVSLRERVLFLLILCAVIFSIGDAMLLSRYDKPLKNLKNQQNNLALEQQNIDSEIKLSTIKLAKAKSTYKHLKQVITDTESLLKQKTLQIENKLNKLVPPTQITELLRNLLTSGDGLKVLSVKNEPVRDIAISTTTNEQSANSNGKKETLLYEHAATIRLSGNYQQLYDYLTALENTGWELFWDTLHYKVTSYPNAEITLRVMTVSTDKHWIGL
jgi:MSHA biogenesis protein MshJ